MKNKIAELVFRSHNPRFDTHENSVSLAVCMEMIDDELKLGNDADMMVILRDWCDRPSTIRGWLKGKGYEYHLVDNMVRVFRIILSI